MTSTTIEQAADKLATADYEFHYRLVTRRLSSGLTVSEVADRMGVDVEFVKNFERYDFNPSLSSLRRYALAIGVTYSHTIEVFE